MATRARGDRRRRGGRRATWTRTSERRSHERCRAERRRARPSGHSDARAKEKLRAFHEEDAIGKAYDARLLRRLWPFVQPHARCVVVSLATLVVIAAINLVRPLVMGDVVRQADQGATRDVSCATGSSSPGSSSSCSR